MRFSLFQESVCHQILSYDSEDLLATTGYIRGGCSPVGMKKLFKTVIDASAESLDKMYVSGGRIGLQIHLSPKDLKNSVNAEFSDILHE